MAMAERIFADPAIRGLDPRHYGAQLADTATHSAAIKAAADAAIAATKRPAVYIPSGTWTISGYAKSSVRFVGDGAGLSVLQHADGVAEPLIHNTDTDIGSPPPAVPYYGFQGVELRAGTQTTALVYYTGNIDNNTKFEDLVLNGNPANNTACDGISIKDYLNLHIDGVRWDGIGGYALRVRDASVFSNADLTISNFSYDNQSGTEGTGPAFGQGLLYLDCSGMSVEKGRISFIGGRIEINDDLASTKPAKSIIRILQNHTRVDSNGPQVTLDIIGVAGDTNAAAKDCKFISCDYKDVAFGLLSFDFYGLNEIYNNDAGDAKNQIPSHVTNNIRVQSFTSDTTPASVPDISRMTMIHGMQVSMHTSDSVLTTSGHFSRGAISYRQGDDGSGGKRVFAAKNVGQSLGRYAGTSSSLGTGGITIGTASLTMTDTLSVLMVPGQLVDVAGAGAAGGILTARVISIDYATNTATLDTNASTTVVGTAVTTHQAVFAYVPMVFYGTAAPVSGSYQRGDQVWNTAPSATGWLGWVCVTAGSPGTWKGFGVIES